MPDNPISPMSQTSLPTIDQLLAELNESQQEAVTYTEGPALVIAGAGSGKTRVLTYKIAYLIRKGIQPWQILALTFTNKAAREMKERIAQLVGQKEAAYLRMGTFHSIFSHILRAEAPYIGYQSNFTIYDETDSRTLLKTIVKEMGLDDKVYKAATLHNRISMAKNCLVLADAYAADGGARERDLRAQIPETHRIYQVYEQRLRQANAMDFDDLLVRTYLLFRDVQEVRERYANRFRYVLVDEYQDTNTVQQWILRQLTVHQPHICVVGDDYQSIYSFRGAKIDNILQFQHDFPHARLFKLEQNYRSTQCIVNAANSLMKHNQHQIAKDVYSLNATGEPLVLEEAYSDREEAAMVCQQIRRKQRSVKYRYSDFAILYRTNAQSRPFEEELRNRSIPYRVVGGLSFYQRKEIKDIIAYFRVVVNPSDETSLSRIINYPTRGIGNTTLQKVSDCAHHNEVSLWQVINHPTTYALSVNKGTLTKLQQFAALIGQFAALLPSQDAYTLGKQIIEQSGIAQDLRQGDDADSISRRENLEELLNSMNEFVEERHESGDGQKATLYDFLQEVSLLTDVESEEGSTDQVTLMTVHAAKGLEFPAVFIVGMEENIFPSQLSLNSVRELEEERRLLYVAITRAKEFCMLTYARNRWRYGHMESYPHSRFLDDIAPRYLRSEGETATAFQPFSRVDRSTSSLPPFASPGRGGRNLQNSRPVATQFMADPMPKQTQFRRVEPPVNPFVHAPQPPAAHTLAVGTVIEHQRFGRGTVTHMEGSGDNEKATVDFRNVGTKQLLLKFAKYTIVKE